MKLQLNQIYLLDEEPHSPYKMLLYPFKIAISSNNYIALKYTDRVKYGGWQAVLVTKETSRKQRESLNYLDARAAIVELFAIDMQEKMK